MAWLPFFPNKKKTIALGEQDNRLIYKMFGSFDSKTRIPEGKEIDEGYEKNMDVYSVFKKIVDVHQSVPYIIERKVSGKWELFENEQEINEFMERPNREKRYTWDFIDEQNIIYLLATGNTYMMWEELNNKIAEIDILPPNYVEAKTSNNFFMPGVSYEFQFSGSNRVFQKDELWHEMLFNPGYCTTEEMFDGLSLIRAASMAVISSNHRWDADINILNNRGAIGLITDKSNRPMTPEEALQAQTTLDSRISGRDKYGKTVVTNKDLNFIQLAMSPQDLQLVEKGVVNLRVICSMLGLDSALFNDPANKVYSNRIEAEKAMYTNAIMPMAKRLDRMYTETVAKSFYPLQDVRIRKDFSKVEALQKDKKTEAEKDKVVTEGISNILSMPISIDSKKILIQESYNVSEEFINSLTELENGQNKNI